VKKPKIQGLTGVMATLVLLFAVAGCVTSGGASSPTESVSACRDLRFEAAGFREQHSVYIEGEAFPPDRERKADEFPFAGYVFCYFEPRERADAMYGLGLAGVAESGGSAGI
jgi:hypothetical protein